MQRNEAGITEKVIFEVLGQPCGKGRPKFSRRGNFVKAYTPEKTANYETLVRFTYQQAGGTLFEVPVKMTIHAFYKIPKSASKKKSEQMQNGSILPVVKPDIDNVIKAIADALNGIAYNDDTQIVRMVAEKHYSDVPRVVVEIEEHGVTDYAGE